MRVPSGANSDSLIARVQMSGQSRGLVKQLPTFDRSRHTLPDAVNSATQGFLARLAAPELQREAEEIFQRARTLFGYKRKDISLDVAAPTAVLHTVDFVYAISYSLDAQAPHEYVVERTLDQVREVQFIQRDACAELFAGVFSDLVFALRKSVRVDAVIDAVEGLDPELQMRVDYPSSYETCTIRVKDVPVDVVCDGASLRLRFPRAGAPGDLVEAFLAVRDAFVLTREHALAGLLG